MSDSALQQSLSLPGLHGYQHALVESYAPMELDASTPANGHAWTVSGQRWGSTGMSHIVASGAICGRIQRDAPTAASRKVILTLVERGDFEFAQGKRATHCPAQSLVLMDISRTLEARQREHVDMLSMIFPKGELAGLIPGLDDLCTRSVPATRGAAAILGQMLKASWQEATALSAAEARALPPAFAPLIEATFGEKAPAQINDEQLTRLLAEIDAELRDPSLGPCLLAERLGISVSYVHALARRSGQSVMSTIMARRLDACRDALRDPAWARRSITDVAFSWGFQDASHFSRRFHQRFGLTPSAWRSAG